MSNTVLSDAEREHLARSVIRLLDMWQVETAAQRSLLGLAEGDTHYLTRWRNGEGLPVGGEVLRRARALLEIQHALETTFPHNAAVVTYWVTTENPYFARQTPLDAMLTGGLPAMEALCDHLNGVSSW